MLKKVKKFIFRISAISLLILFNQSKVLSIENSIILKIDNKIITNIDIQNEAKYLKALNPNLQSLDKNRIIKIAKTSLIREKIKEIEISKSSLGEIDDEYLDNVIKSIYKNLNFRNKDEFLTYIKSFQIDIATIERKLSGEAYWNQLIYKKFFSKLKIDKQKIKKEILSNKQTLNSYLLYEIFYNVEDNPKSKELFKKIEESISVDGFENAASIYSVSESSKTGGKLGWISENSIDKKILSKILNLQNGEYTSPILLPGGFLILFVKDKKEIKKEIDVEKELTLRIRSLQNQQLNQYSNIYFKKIKKNILINEK